MPSTHPHFSRRHLLLYKKIYHIPLFYQHVLIYNVSNNSSDLLHIQRFHIDFFRDLGLPLYLDLPPKSHFYSICLQENLIQIRNPWFDNPCFSSTFLLITWIKPHCEYFCPCITPNRYN